MSPDRRSFCASLAALGLPLRKMAANTSHILRSSEIVESPGTVHAFFEDGTVELKRNGTSWLGDGVSVETQRDSSGDVLHVSVSCPGHRIMRVRLHWQGTLPKAELFMGDAWERSYGDLGWRSFEPERIFPWYFLAGSHGLYTAAGVQTNPAAFCFWQIDPSGVTLWLDLRNGGGGVELGERTLHAADVVALEHGEQTGFQAARSLCRKMAQGTGPFMPAPLYGGNNWYYAYGHSSADYIRADTERIASWAPSGSNRPFMVIDDGWSPYRTTGPWNRGNDRFPDMARLASDMLQTNVKPGIWFRPLTTRDAVPEALLLKNNFTEARYVKEQMRTLDPTIEGAAEQIRSDVKQLCSWGFDLLKHDFSTYDLFGRWGFQMGSEITDSGWHFADRKRTNAEITRAFYSTLRDAAGKTSLLGCNTVGHLSTGLFEVQRTGDDTSGRDWSRTRKMGVNTLAFRSPQQGVFFDVDADCVGLTKSIPWSLNRQWLDLLARSGTPLFVSAAPDALGPEQQAALRQAFASAAVRQPVCEPLDWLDINEPQHWRLGANVSRFDWYSEDTSLPL